MKNNLFVLWNHNWNTLKKTKDLNEKNLIK